MVLHDINGRQIPRSASAPAALFMCSQLRAMQRLLLPIVVYWEERVLNPVASVETCYRLPGGRGAERGQRSGKARIGAREGIVDHGELSLSQPL